MQKTVIIVLTVMLAAALLGGCDDNKQTAEERANSYNISIRYEDEAALPETFEEVMAASDNIVKAELASAEEFGGIYRFNVVKDYTGNTPEEIYLYHPYDEKYIKGHTYYLCLNRSENPLYPHSIFTSAYMGLILDCSDKKVWLTESEKIRIREAEERIQSFTEANSAKFKEEYDTKISYSADINSLKKEAEGVAEIRLLTERKVNKYKSTYDIETVNMIKGNEAYMPYYQVLPPGLELNSNYYVFLKKDPDCDTNYILFSKEKPVTPVTDETKRMLEGDTIE